MQYYVYILANATNAEIYVGVTNDLVRRVHEHKAHIDPDSFTARYRVDRLVYYEPHASVEATIGREKQIKGWNRRRKDALVASMNPGWVDLHNGLLQ